MKPFKPEKDFDKYGVLFRKYKNYFWHFHNEQNPDRIEKKQQQVWNKIEASLNMQEKKPRISAFAMAASISLIVGAVLVILFILPKNNEMEMIAAHWSLDEQKNTQLILSDTETVLLGEDESVVDYSSSETIAINDKSSEKKNIYSYNSLIVPYGKRSKVILSDGTTVWVNSGSKLIYPTTFADNSREIYMEGEAYFEVNEDKERPFIVQTKNMDIKVLGTGFNITAYANEAKASAVLVHGSIEMKTNKNSLFLQKKEILKPNERALYDHSNQTLQIKEVDTEYYVSWTKGYLKFNNSKLQTIINKMEKYYDVDVSIQDPALLNKTFTGKLDLKQDIEEVLEIICATTSLQYIKDERRYVLDKK